MPLTSKTFSQLIDFTRTSAATYVDQLGRIVPTPVSLNEYTFTQEFDNVAWSRNSSTLTANNALAPDGSMTADTFTAQAGTALRPEMTQVVSTVSGGLYTISYNVRPVTHSFIQIIINAQTAEWVNFTLSGAGTATANGPCAASIVLDPLTGWYRISMTYTAGGTDRRPVLCMIPSAAAGRAATFNPLGTEVIRVWGAQLEQTPDANLTLGSELVTNGDFAGGSTGWTAGTGWAIGSGVASAAAATAGGLYTSSAGYVTGKVYRVQVDKTGTATLTAYLRGGAAATTTASGTVVLYVVAGSSSLGIEFYMSSAGGTIDNISVREVTAASPSTYTRNFGGRFPPRFDYDPVTLAPRGLLIEEQRTNLVTRSEEFDNAAWQKTGVTITANAATSPDGTVDADKLVEDSTSAAHQTFNGPISISAGSTYTYTVYAKAAERSWFAISAWDTSERFTYFNLATGVVGTNAVGNTATITPVGNGWYRCRVTRTVSAATTYGQFFVSTADNVVNYTGSAGSGVFIWGAQIEAGAFATSYIPTVASQVTRTADTAAITGSNFSPWYNPAEGTMVCEWSPYVEGAFTPLSITDGSFNNRIQLSGYNTIQFLTSNGGATQAILDAGSITGGAVNKVAGAYRVNDFAASTNGSGAVTDTSGTIPTVNRLSIGNLSGIGEHLNGHIRSIRYYPTRLTNAQLQALTA